MSPITILIIFISYFILLMIVSFYASRNSNSFTFFNANKKSPWYLVAFGMIGATLSGITFISVPGEVGNSNFHYLQFVFGNFIGYIIIATLLLPFYYQKNVISIYSVLKQKTGYRGHQTASAYFLISKIIGAAFRLFLAAGVLQIAIFKPLGIPFEINLIICLVMIWLYTYKSGIKTVVFTDAFQTTVILIATISAIFILHQSITLHIETEKLYSSLPPIFDFNWKSPNYFFKQFLSGIFITIAINGFDQDIIQKNLTCKTPAHSRKNMLWFSILFVIAIFIFLLLGYLLYQFASINAIDIPEKTDHLFPIIALKHLSSTVAILFILGVSAAAFSSADSAITSLTTAFCVDFLNYSKQKSPPKRDRIIVHLIFTIIILFTILLFYQFNNQSIVIAIFKAAGYTYGPILALFIFSFISKRGIVQKAIIPLMLLSPVFTFGIIQALEKYISGYKFGFEIIIVNTLISFIFLWLFSTKKLEC